MAKEIDYAYSFRPLRNIGTFVSSKGTRAPSAWLDKRALVPLRRRPIPRTDDFLDPSFKPVLTGNEIRLGA